MAKLEVISGRSAGQSFELDPREKTSVGNSRGADVSIKDRTIAMRHVQIYRDDGVWYCKDAGSRNGTSVNGKKLESKRAARLTGDDTMILGECEVRFTDESAAPPAPAAAPAPAPAPAPAAAPAPAPAPPPATTSAYPPPPPAYAPPSYAPPPAPRAAAPPPPAFEATLDLTPEPAPPPQQPPTELLDQLDALKAQVASKDQEIEGLRVQVRTFQQVVLDKERSAGAVEDQAAEARTALAQLNAQLETAQKDLRDQAAASAQVVREKATLQARLTEFDTKVQQLSDLQQQLSQLQGDAKMSEDIISRLQADKKEAVAARDRAEVARFAAEKVKLELETKAAGGDRDAARLEGEIAKLRNALADLTRTHQGLEGELEERCAELMKKSVEVRAARRGPVQALSELQTKSDNLEAEVNLRNAELAALNLRLADLETKNQGLDVLVDTLSGGSAAADQLNTDLLAQRDAEIASLKKLAASGKQDLAALHKNYNGRMEALEAEKGALTRALEESEGKLAELSASVPRNEIKQRMQELQEDNANTTRMLERMNDTLALRDKELAELKKEQAWHRDKVKEADQEVEQARKELNQRIEQLDRIREERDRLRGDKHDALEQASSAGAERQRALEERLRTAESTLAERDRELASLTHELSEKTSAASEATRERDERIHRLESQIDSLRHDSENSGREESQALERLTKVEEELGAVTTALEQAAKERNAFEARCKELESAGQQLDGLTKRSEEAEAKVAELRGELDKAIEEITEIEAEKDKQVEELMQEVEDLQAQLGI